MFYFQKHGLRATFVRFLDGTSLHFLREMVQINHNIKTVIHFVLMRVQGLLSTLLKKFTKRR